MNLFYIAILQSTYIGSGNGWSNLFGILGQLFLLIFIFIFVVVLAYFSTKWIANNRYVSKYLKRADSNLRMIERIGVGPQGSVGLLKIGEKYILIGITKDKISFLTEVDKDEITHETYQ